MIGTAPDSVGWPKYEQIHGPPSEQPAQQKISPSSSNGVHSNSAKQLAHVFGVGFELVNKLCPSDCPHSKLELSSDGSQ